MKDFVLYNYSNTRFALIMITEKLTRATSDNPVFKTALLTIHLTVYLQEHL